MIRASSRGERGVELLDVRLARILEHGGDLILERGQPAVEVGQPAVEVGEPALSWDGAFSSALLTFFSRLAIFVWSSATLSSGASAQVPLQLGAERALLRLGEPARTDSIWA